ncbi:hypothetical protein ACHAXS_000757 [Conticribra weissflogii]
MMCNSLGNEEKRTQILHILQFYTKKLILEVFGSAGAIWGFSEVIGLRVPTTIWFWRPCAFSVGLIFFGCWVCEIMKDFEIESGSLTLWMKRTTPRGGVDKVAKEDVCLVQVENTKYYT